MLVSVPTEEIDQVLLDRARAGDQGALEQLLERHQTQVFRFGMKMCRDPEDAKEVLQDTLLAMARSVRDLRGASSISTWLYTVARSFCIKKRRRSKFAPEREHSLDTEDGGELADEARAPDETVAGKEVQRALEHAIDSLDPTYREVLILRDAEGLTAQEVAEVLGVSVDAVKSRLHRARVTVRREIAPLLGIPSTLPPAQTSCPDVLTLFSRHLEGELSADTCAEMETHLVTCARCRHTCDSLRQTLALCRTAGAFAEVPASIQTRVKVALRDLLSEKS